MLNATGTTPVQSRVLVTSTRGISSTPHRDS